MARPFVRWAGGKTQLLPELRKRVPEKFGRYYEPFIGGGALFFELSSSTLRAALNDTNGMLITTYTMVCNDVEDLIKRLHRHAKAHSEAHYYWVRKNFEHQLDPIDDAADLIYLNKACFNGVYRVNRKGEFNVPWGKRPEFVVDEENLRACSRALQRDVHLTVGDFESAVATAKKGDFVYFDPPYVPASASANFTSYQKEPFGPKEQERLRDVALNLKQRGVKVLLSNSDTPFVRKLYGRAFYMERVTARRSINCKTAKRGAVSELLIT